MPTMNLCKSVRGWTSFGNSYMIQMYWYFNSRVHHDIQERTTKAWANFPKNPEIDHSTVLAWALQKVFIFQMNHCFANDLINGKLRVYIRGRDKYCFKYMCFKYSKKSSIHLVTSSLVIYSLSIYCVPGTGAFKKYKDEMFLSWKNAYNVFWGRKTYKLLV